MTSHKEVILLYGFFVTHPPINGDGTGTFFNINPLNVEKYALRKLPERFRIKNGKAVSSFNPPLSFHSGTAEILYYTIHFFNVYYCKKSIFVI